ncbi:putative phage abortive infection protein [Achromobacter ruhlandii]|uniref:Phage abortive infection protein n=1 Tax=Achromobacter ruhlandii TaxID=72557 RepID=A0A2M9GSZ8_9BURK|nr:putative phage abortive infection protein [Achromobacter ruhlandii]PJM67691.1 hypothetical protein CV751_23745 [Achromobacter ruhlandii]CAB3904445.1 hypothetical protein LMG3328_04466 [Achromobacter ruhlandii]
MEKQGRGQFEWVWLTAAVLIPIVVGIVAIALYRAHFPGHFAVDDQGKWGTFGDFIGGILNPVVGVVTLVLLVRTLLSQQKAIQLQSEELRLQRRELALQRAETAKSTQALDDQYTVMVQQNTEQSLFNWLNSYRALVREFTSSKHPGNGTALLKEIVGMFSMRSVCRQHQELNWPWIGTINEWYIDQAKNGDEDRITNLIECMRRAKHIYADQFSIHDAELGAMLRTLYRLLSWIEKSHRDDVEAQWHYMAIVRAQLSQPELVLMAFNGLTKNGARLAELANKFAIFDNLNLSADLLLLCIRDCYSTGRFQDLDLNNVLAQWPYRAEAFDSDLARAKLFQAESLPRPS